MTSFCDTEKSPLRGYITSFLDTEKSPLRGYVTSFGDTEKSPLREVTSTDLWVQKVTTKTKVTQPVFWIQKGHHSRGYTDRFVGTENHR